MKKLKALTTVAPSTPTATNLQRTGIGYKRWLTTNQITKNDTDDKSVAKAAP